MFYYVDDTCCHVYTAEEVVLAAKQNYGVDIIWEQPKDKIVMDDVDTSHMVYSSKSDELYWQEEKTMAVLLFTDIFKTADGSPLPEPLIEDIKVVYAGAEFCIEESSISATCRC